MPPKPPLDEEYFVWLLDKVGGPNGNVDNKYNRLLRLLFQKEFVWIIPNDDNRAEDGKDLRCAFINHKELDVEDIDPYWLELGCSVFEMLIALAKRLSFETDGFPSQRDTSGWFWGLIENLGLSNPRMTSKKIEESLNRLIWRTYEPNGRGGLFPLQNPNGDQRKTEIWYQMCEYVIELGI
jgi:hypothetical protein